MIYIAFVIFWTYRHNGKKNEGRLVYCAFVVFLPHKHNKEKKKTFTVFLFEMHGGRSMVYSAFVI